MNIKKIIRLIKYFLDYKFYIKDRNFKSKKKTDLSIILNNLDKYGYHVIPKYLSQKNCLKMIKEINRKFNILKKIVKIDKKKSDHRLWRSEIYVRGIIKFNKDKFLKEISEQFMKTKMNVLCTLANKVVYKKNNLGSGGGWHRDNYNPEFKAILYLSNVKTDNGPFQLIPGSHKVSSIIKNCINLNKYYPETRFKNSEIKKVLKKNNVKTIIGKPGTLLLVNTRMIHRGKPIKNEKRFAITNYYFPNKLMKEQKKKLSSIVSI